MPSTRQLTARANARAIARAPAFRSAGMWGLAGLDLVAQAAEHQAEHGAVVTRTASFTYGDLDRTVSAAASRLGQSGVRPDDAVLVVVGNDMDSLVAIHAVLRVGGLALLVTASAGAAHVRDVVDQAVPCLGVAPLHWLQTHSEFLASELPWINSQWDEPVSTHFEQGFAIGRRDPDTAALVIFTSGTTSRPKGVIHSLNTLAAASRNYIGAASLRPSDRLFLVSPMASVTGVLQAVTIPPLLGAQVILEDKWNPGLSFEFLQATGGTFFGGTDLLLNELLDEAERRGINSVSIASVFLGGAMLDARILKRVEQQFGIVVMPAYGSSEAPISTCGTRDEPSEVRVRDDGRPLDGVLIRIGSSSDPGECCISGPHLFLGYTDPDDDARAFDGGGPDGDWFCTGDLANFTDGRLKITGRIKDIVIRKGMKIPIAEVEGLMATLPGVAQAAGFGVGDSDTGEHLAIAVRMDPGAELIFEAVVSGLLGRGLAKWKLPEEVVIWDEHFPETTTGKVQRTQLAQLSAGFPRLAVARLASHHSSQSSQ